MTENRNIDYVKLEKAAEKCMRVTDAVLTVCVFVPLTVLGIILLEAKAPVLLGVAAVWVLLIAEIIFVPKIRYERYRYCIDDEAIRVREGFIWITESIVPIERLHKIAASQGPIARAFKLTAVEVTTAGGDVTIKFLTEEAAAEITEKLKAKINEIAVQERKNQACKG